MARALLGSDQMSADLELLQKWSDGDASAGNQLFNRHFDPVCRFFANKVSEDVDDLIQKTFLHLASFATYSLIRETMMESILETECSCETDSTRKGGGLSFVNHHLLVFAM